MVNCNLSGRNLLSIIPILLVTLLSSCSQKKPIVSVDPAFAKYIASYTTGVVSKTSVIRIQLAENTKVTHALGEQTGNTLFEFSPSIKGKAYWIDAKTIEFRPEKTLNPGTLYTITFHLGKVMDVPEKFSDFTFNVEITAPAFVVHDDGLRSNTDGLMMFLPGTIETADIEENKEIEKLITATHNHDDLKISWQHEGASRIHHFTIENILRTKADDSLQLQWNGKSIGSKINGSKNIMVPAQGNFILLDVRAVNSAGQYVSVLFSDPISITQELTGLLSISGVENTTYAINGSEVKLFPGEQLEGDFTVNINNGIQNTLGGSLEKSYVSNISFDTKKPSVRIEGKGNILPHEGKLTLPFTSINLNAIDVSIIKIYENNIPQFLQNNGYDSDNDLRQVGTPIVQQTIRLDDDKTLDLHTRQRFAIDIDRYLKTEPGAIYRIVIGFRPEYSLYDCKDKLQGKENDENGYGYAYENETAPDDQEQFWSRYDNYYPYGYNWQQRDNPCYASYYNKEKFAFRNIIASNIGIIAQRGSSNTLSVIVTDMLSAKPLASADIIVLDYQQQVIGKTSTNSDGFATIELKQKPFLVIVSKEKEKGYLKVDDGSSLPLSRFDIAGEEVKNGIKGFIFGERGVWRPGDSLYISFIEQDLDNKLPEDHPIEFELYNPLGQMNQKLIQKNESGGFNVFRATTDQHSPTGNWLAKIKVGGVTFEKTIRIETVMPNRLSVQLDFGNDTLLGKNQNNEGTLKVAWLFGAPASNLNATIDLSLSVTKKSFPNFPGFVFYNPVANIESKKVNIFDGQLNNEGIARVKTNIKTDDNAPGMMRANMLIKVFEPGGAFSIKTLSLPYSPFSSYAGIQLPKGDNPWNFLTTGITHSAKLVNIDPKGNLLNGRSSLEVSFYKIQWRWWWDHSNEDFSNFTQDKYNKLIKTETISLENGKGEWNFKVPENDWGRFLVLVKDAASGHITGDVIYIDDPGWQSRENTDDPTAASMLSFTSDKPSYNAGDDITLTIPGSTGGRGLITLTSGSSTIKSWWIDMKAGQTKVTFKAEKDWAPNVYAQVSLLQPYGQTVNDLPMRMYGVIPIKIENKETVLSPVINMASSIRPEQQVSMTVSEKNSREMWYTIAIVDDGLLDLTNYQTPDPHNYFFSREALSVKFWDLFDNVIGAWGYNIERILTIGGDQEGAGPVQQKQANRFKPVVKFMGPFKLQKGKKDTRTFTLPQYAGSVSVMVIAAGNNAFGSAQKTVQVKKPLMLLATLPRVLSPGEKTRIPVTVFATENNVRSARIRLQTNPLFEITSAPAQQVNFTKPGEQTIFFEVTVGNKTGIGKVRLTANSNGEKAEYDEELNIRNANPYITKVASFTIDPAASENIAINSFGSNAASHVEISSLPPIDLQKHIDFLIDYPHGCAEQITSRVFVQLYLSRLSDLSASQKAIVEKNIKAGIASLQNFQTMEGGFSYWPNDRQSDEWTSNYAGHFLLEANAAGYSIPEQMLQRWKVYEKNKANNWAPSTTQFFGADLMQAYRLFVLALAKSPELGAMNRLKEFKYISPQAKWRLAAAYQLAGQPSTANTLISGLPQSFKENDERYITYGSELRDEAMVLETLVLMGKRQLAEPLLKKIAAKLSQDQWYSTQTTAYALLSIAEFIGKNNTGNKIKATVQINGKDSTVESERYVVSIPVNKDVKIRNDGSAVLFVKSISKGQPLTGEKIDIRNNPGLLKMNVSYITSDKKPIDITHLMQGADFIIKVSVTNPGNRAAYRRMALTQIVPSGWEILNTRLFGSGGFSSSPMQYQDIRDDRVYTYFDLPPKETKTFYLNITAAYSGRYYLPAFICNEMYDKEIQAAEEGKWVTVSEPEEMIK